MNNTRFAGGFIPLFLILSAGAAPWLLGDTVAIHKPGEGDAIAPTVYSDVKVTNILVGRVVFTTSSGNSVDKPLSTVVAMTIDDEPQFNQAQQDYAAHHWDQAASEYQQTIETTSKAWLKSYCEPRMTEAAEKAGRFDAAVQGFIWMVLNQPKEAGSYRPVVPGVYSPLLDPAAQSLSEAAGTQGLSDAQQTLLLSVLLDVQRARKDAAGADEVASRLAKLVGDTGTTGNAAAEALADARIAEARAAVKGGNFDKASDIISSSATLFLNPAQQDDALYLLAEARAGQARTAGDTAAWQDAAIAYMRVVADFKDAPGAPHVAESLNKAAAILAEQLHQPDKAVTIYQSVERQYPGTAEAEVAAKQIAALKAAGGAAQD